MKATEIGVFDAKTHLSEILQRVQSGERFLITRRGLRLAELRPIEPERKPLERGAARNPSYHMAPDFDAPLAEMEDGL